MNYLIRINLILVLIVLAKCDYYSELGLIDLGEADLSHNKMCLNRMQKFYIKCTEEYAYKVKEKLYQTDDWNHKLVRKARCCGVLQAKRCFSSAARSIQYCGVREARAFEKLPIEKNKIYLMEKQCSDYIYGYSRCNNSNSFNASLKFFLTIILASLIINYIA